MYAENSTYTHSSILHILQELWGLEGLNNRVQRAKTFESVSPMSNVMIRPKPWELRHSMVEADSPSQTPSIASRTISDYASLDQGRPH